MKTIKLDMSITNTILKRYRLCQMTEYNFMNEVAATVIYNVH